MKTFAHPMTEEQYDAWIAALKSGKYVQGRSTLYKRQNGVHKYCCLGVAAEICGKLNTGQRSTLIVNLSAENKELWLLPNDIQQRLAVMNDVDEMSFNEIAEHLISMKSTYLARIKQVYDYQTSR